jgi:hypothetical protein
MFVSCSEWSGTKRSHVPLPSIVTIVYVIRRVEENQEGLG